jgi:hypothetical protein
MVFTSAIYLFLSGVSGSTDSQEAQNQELANGKQQATGLTIVLNRNDRRSAVSRRRPRWITVASNRLKNQAMGLKVEGVEGKE